MKFGRLFSLELADTDWPKLRYKLLKKLIKQRITEHQLTSIFQTGTFKKCIRADLEAINTFWLSQEATLIARSRLCANLPYLRQQHDDQVHACLKWLALNYLAVLKIAKKHDKHCGTQLHGVMATILMMQPFVVGMRSSPLFFPPDCDAASSPVAVLESLPEERPAASFISPSAPSTPTLAPSSSRSSVVDMDDPITHVISQLLDAPAAHYFPERLQQHIASLEDSACSFSDEELHREAEEDRRRIAQRRAVSASKGEPLEPCYEHGKPIAAPPSQDNGLMIVSYLALVG